VAISQPKVFWLNNVRLMGYYMQIWTQEDSEFAHRVMAVMGPEIFIDFLMAPDADSQLSQAAAVVLYRLAKREPVSSSL
jgi:hypothetical protein